MPILAPVQMNMFYSILHRCRTQASIMRTNAKPTKVGPGWESKDLVPSNHQAVCHPSYVHVFRSPKCWVGAANGASQSVLMAFTIRDFCRGKVIHILLHSHRERSTSQKSSYFFISLKTKNNVPCAEKTHSCEPSRMTVISSSLLRCKAKKSNAWFFTSYVAKARECHYHRCVGPSPLQHGEGAAHLWAPGHGGVHQVPGGAWNAAFHPRTSLLLRQGQRLETQMVHWGHMFSWRKLSF